MLMKTETEGDMNMMFCLALFMGVNTFPPPTYEYLPNLLSRASTVVGWYIETRHAAVLLVDRPDIRAHEAVHHLQHMNSIPYDEQQAYAASRHYMLQCHGENQ